MKKRLGMFLLVVSLTAAQTLPAFASDFAEEFTEELAADFVMEETEEVLPETEQEAFFEVEEAFDAAAFGEENPDADFLDDEQIENEIFFEMEEEADTLSAENLANATAISPNSTQSGSISENHEKDVYKFELSDSSTFRFSAAASIPYVSYGLYNWDGERIVYNSIRWDSGLESGSFSYERGLISGTYYLVVERIGTNYGSYSFSTEAVSSGESFSESKNASNNTLETASRINTCTNYTGMICTNDEVDLYKIVKASAGAIQFSIIYHMPDLNLYLYDESGKRLQSANSHYESETKTGSFESAFYVEKGTYYIGIESSVNANGIRAHGTYEFSYKELIVPVSFQIADDNTREKANAISLNYRYIGVLALNDDVDFYTFVLPEAQTVKIESTSSDLPEATFYLYDAEGKNLLDDNCFMNSSTNVFRYDKQLQLSEGTYYLAVGRHRERCGSYMVMVSVADGWTYRDGNWYYYTDWQKAIGWKKIDDKWYYFNQDGVMQKKWVSVKGTWYYCGDNGVMQTGWQKIGNSWYHFNEGGAMQTGWQQIGGSKYYFNESGAMQTGWKKIDDYWYHLSASGAMDKEWIAENGIWYYLGQDGKMVTDWQQIGGQWYHFTSAGVMQKAVSGWNSIDGTYYYLNADRTAYTGWLQSGNNWYYMNYDGIMRTGWQNVNNVWYFFSSSGKMVTGWHLINGKWYYFEGSGKMHTGWLQTGSQWYYMNQAGAMVTGTHTINGKTYTFNDNGIML